MRTKIDLAGIAKKNKTRREGNTRNRFETDRRTQEEEECSVRREMKRQKKRKEGRAK